MLMNRTECLEAAAHAVADREGKYGTPSEVCMCNVAQKVSRLCCDPTHDDSWVDVAGFAANGVEVVSK